MRFGFAGLAGLGLALAALVHFGRAAEDPYAKFLPKMGARTPEEERKAFHLPPGFEAQLVASEPMIHKPINLAFDDKGRQRVACGRGRCHGASLTVNIVKGSAEFLSNSAPASTPTLAIASAVRNLA